MGQVKVLQVSEDPQNPQRQIVEVRAIEYCQHNPVRGNRFEMSGGQTVRASIARNAFRELAVGMLLDGALFCRFAVGHEQILI